MYEIILVPLDGSPLSERALMLAITMAQGRNTRLALMRATGAAVSGDITVHPSDPSIASVDECRAYLTGLASRLTARGIAADIVVEDTPAVEGILRAVKESRAQLVVMCTHGRSGLGRWIYGSVAEGVLSASPVPVMLVRPTGPAVLLSSEHNGPVLLVPLDGSQLAEAALPEAATVARQTNATIHLMRVAPVSASPLEAVLFPTEWARFDDPEERSESEKYLGQVAQRYQQQGLRVTTTVRPGWPADGILEQARAIKAAMIVMATHGRTGLSQALLGSVALEVLWRGTTPLLLVRPFHKT